MLVEPDHRPSGEAANSGPHRTFKNDPVLKWELGLALPSAGLGGVVGDIIRVLIQCWNEDEGYARPSEKFIAREIGKKDARSVREHLSKVLASGLVTMQRGRQHEPNRYFFNWAMVNQLVQPDKKAFAGRCARYREQDAVADRKEHETSGTSFKSQRHFTQTERKKDVSRPEGNRSRPEGTRIPDRKEDVIQTGENLPPNTRTNLTYQNSRSEPMTQTTEETRERVRADAGASHVSSPQGLGIKAQWAMFRDLYPNKKGKENYIYGSFKQAVGRYGFDTVILGLQRYVDHLQEQQAQGFEEQPANATSWLIDRRWEDRYASDVC